MNTNISPKISFLNLLLLLYCFEYLINRGSIVEASHFSDPSLRDVFPFFINKLHRTAFHFQPKARWMNDPNAPMYYKGFYHLFYQYNPKGSIWGNVVWAHSVSKDLITWKALEPAIYPSKSFDKFGVWSGSATIGPDNKPIIHYTGIIDQINTQVQAYAKPMDYSDPYLSKWVKPDIGNPFATGIGKFVNKTAFRDPSTAWLGQDGEWRMVVGSKWNMEGVVLLYKSKDLVKWVQAENPFHSKDNTGLWECPDFYPVSTRNITDGLDTSVNDEYVRHVLKVSLDLTRHDYYTIGTYDTVKDVYIPDKSFVDGFGGLRYDYGNFYASKSFFDPIKTRRILWGWVNESDSIAYDVAKGWAGLMAIPRKVWLDTTSGKQLLQWPVEELETLRGSKVTMINTQMKTGDNIKIDGVTGAQADVEVTFSFSSMEKAETFDPKWEDWDAEEVCKQINGRTVQGGVGPFGLLTLASSNLEEATPVFFKIYKTLDMKYKVLMCSDARSSSKKSGTFGWYTPSFGGFVNVDISNNEISLKSLIDHSVVESFGGGGRTCITSRVYPTLAVKNNAHLYAFNYGSESILIKSLNAWSMKAANPMNESIVRELMDVINFQRTKTFHVIIMSFFTSLVCAYLFKGK